MKKTNGITLIALIITIILMLILASITVTVAINGGLFEYAGGAKDSAEIANEKDMVSEAFAWAESNSKTGRVTVEDLQRNLDTEKPTAVIDNGDSLVVKFNESNRYYEIEPSGKIEGPKELIKEDNPGDLSKGNKYDGKTDTTAFRITCIEDLVEFSKNYTKYNKGYIKLERTLDFKSIFSYRDYTSKAYGDLNGDGDVDDIRTELTKQGENCAGFPPISQLNAEGTFDGQNNKICNLYENVTNGDAGLFKVVNGSIKNLGLKNINLTSTGAASGIAVTSRGKISNCSVEGTSIINSGSAGLIVKLLQNADIENCYSIGKLEGEIGGTLGGIVAQAQNVNIKRCFNMMDIEVGGQSGGIVGMYQRISGDDSYILTIEECYHIGNITNNNSNTAGIAGAISNKTVIKNCYNIGNISGKVSGGIAGGINYGDIFNCYSIGEIFSQNYGGIINGTNYGAHLVHCFGRRGDFGELPEGVLELDTIKKYLSGHNGAFGQTQHNGKQQIGYACNVLTDEEMKEQSFVDELNVYIEAGISGENEGVITESAQNVWKMDEEGINGGYPIFTWQTKGKTKY